MKIVDMTAIAVMCILVGAVGMTGMHASKVQELANTEAIICDLRGGKYIATYQNKSNTCLDKRYLIDLSPKGI